MTGEEMKAWFDAKDKKWEGSEGQFKVSIYWQLYCEKIIFHKEHSILSYPEGFGKKWSLLADFCSWPNKNWLIECKIKADVSSCSKALGQCIMYRELAGYQNPIICFPAKEYFQSGCMEKFEEVCQANNIKVATEHSILNIVKKYEPLDTTSTNPELRTVENGSEVIAKA